MTPIVALAVVGAGALGAVLRYVVSLIGARASWPWPVLAVNVAGSLLAGVAFHTDAALVVAAGFCGGVTTFSTLSVETVQLVAEGRARAASASVVLNVVVGVGAATAGWMLGSLAF